MTNAELFAKGRAARTLVQRLQEVDPASPQYSICQEAAEALQAARREINEAHRDAQRDAADAFAQGAFEARCDSEER